MSSPELNNRKSPPWPPEDTTTPMYWLSRRRPAEDDGFGCLFGCAIMMLSAMVTVAGIILLVRALVRAVLWSR
jgi:hypothetical protein